ncbi:hypothetical protein HQ45_02345 [Porphyromonas crevioricanis]|uniref:Lipoprotein NlpI n=2 Tax=Porphyromonas crevioricanis TaxID=393921 RepID=A0AB34PFP8_9PORP|nr:hypothetical protein HQ45_02345 [Porphyromonas crevioricanis]KGN95065.1 hypothetical protein HQ38_04600 [Porphyromonas crevioricanis]
MQRSLYIRSVLFSLCILLLMPATLLAQIDADRVMRIGRNALYYNDYVVAIGYFNQVIGTRPWLAEPYFYRSIAKLSLEDYSGALGDADSALRQNRFIPGAYLVRGIARQNTQQYEKAEADYRKGLQLAPNNEGLGLNLTNLLLYREQYGAADTAARDLLQYHPQSQAGKLMLAEARWGLQDSITALDLIGAIIKDDSLFAPAYLSRSKIYYQNEKLQEAITDLDQAIAIAPEELNSYVNRGIMRYQNNDIRGAMADYDHVIEEDPEHHLARYNRALLKTYVGSYSKALSDFDVVIRQEPDNHFALYNRGLILSRNSRYNEAIKDFDKVLTAYPDFSICYLARSEAKRGLGKMKDAERDYLTAIKLEEKQQREIKRNPNLPTLKKKQSDNKEESRDERDRNIEKFNLLVMSSDRSKASSEYASKLRGRIQNKDVNINTRELFTLTYYCGINEENLPVSYFDNTVEQLNATSSLPLRLIVCNTNTPINTGQIEFLEQEIKTTSGHTLVSSRIRQGLAYLQMQNHEQAITLFDVILAQDSSFAIAYLGRSIARSRLALADRDNHIGEEQSPLKSESSSIPSSNTPQPSLKKPSLIRGQLQQAVSDLDRVILLSPHSAIAYYNRAWILAEQGDSASAISDYTSAIEIYPKFADAYYNRGLLLLSVGKASEGIADLSKAGELGLYEVYSIIKRFNK